MVMCALTPRPRETLSLGWCIAPLQGFLQGGSFGKSIQFIGRWAVRSKQISHAATDDVCAIGRTTMKACKAAIDQPGVSSFCEPRVGGLSNDRVPQMSVIWR